MRHWLGREILKLEVEVSCGGGFFLACEDLGRMFDNLFPCLRFFLLLFFFF